VSLEGFIRSMPKVELHVHLIGAITPQRLLALAHKNAVPLPVSTVEGMRDWFRFRDFAHFIEVYVATSHCIQTQEDIEEVARDFLAGQAAQNIRYTEFTHTAWVHVKHANLEFRAQLAALNRARTWARHEHGIESGIVIDIPRNITGDEGITVANWAISGAADGVVALGLGGNETDNPPERFRLAFERARAAGLPSVPHAGETVGPASIWGALQALGAYRIGHGIRCLEDPFLVAELRDRRVALELCPSSNVCLAGVPSFEQHPIGALLHAGLLLTINSDDPTMFNTTLTDEFRKVSQSHELGADTIELLTLNAIQASCMTSAVKAQFAAEFHASFAVLREDHGVA
jgi:aminodeoxyfutalosine deaminase